MCEPASWLPVPGAPGCIRISSGRTVSNHAARRGQMRIVFETRPSLMLHFSHLSLSHTYTHTNKHTHKRHLIKIIMIMVMAIDAHYM